MLARNGVPKPGSPLYLEDPPLARELFGSIRWAWLWIVVRLSVGYVWVDAAWAKLTSPDWVGVNSGSALTAFVSAALPKAHVGSHPDVQGWYAAFLQSAVLPHAALWSHLVAYGELLVGVGLMLGILTGVASGFGVLMNASYLLAGTVSLSPLLLAGELLLIVAWKTAGWWGIDRWLLPAMGTPWAPGPLLRRRPRLTISRSTEGVR
jgi:thiosulfate dehydrogenase [quinone] large subunit